VGGADLSTVETREGGVVNGGELTQLLREEYNQRKMDRKAGLR